MPGTLGTPKSFWGILKLGAKMRFAKITVKMFFPVFVLNKNLKLFVEKYKKYIKNKYLYIFTNIVFRNLKRPFLSKLLYIIKIIVS